MMKNNDFCVIGLSKFGKTVAETLINLHKNVLVIDSDSKKVEAIASLVTWAIILDVTDKEALLKAEVDKFSNAIIAFDDDLITSIICAIILKAEFNIPNILARSINSHHSKILSMLGINIIVESEIESGKKAALKSI
jgi:trk system potassium uptake protein TrkA